jgi:ABC-type branched-subunit amino acid transport system substrate-binding protein
MKISVFWAACAAVAFTLSLGGCANQAQPSHTVSQKQTASQMANKQTYFPPYNNGQNVAASRFQTQPVPPAGATVISAAPVAAQPVAGKAVAAILLPLSGKNAALGQAMLNAAQQAVFDVAGNNFDLQPHDTAGNGGADGAAREALAAGAQIIIGPLFATDVPAVKAVAQNTGVQILPLSTDTSLAEPGVYVMGLAPGAQVQRVVDYAIAQGSHNFAALVPSTPYGVLVNDVFINQVAQRGGNVVASVTYDPEAPDVNKIKSIAAQHVDALFLPEQGGDLKKITDPLTAAGFDAAHTHILGTGLWDVPDLGKQVAWLNGGWYAAPDPAARHAFIDSYTAAYGAPPPRLATLAYDATALAAVIAKHNGRYDAASLTNPNGFAGLDGIFRLTPSGVVERGLAVDQVTPDGGKVIESAPTSFVMKGH